MTGTISNVQPSDLGRDAIHLQDADRGLAARLSCAASTSPDRKPGARKRLLSRWDGLGADESYGDIPIVGDELRFWLARPRW